MMLPINVGVPPTRFALKARPYFLALLLGQAALVVGRFVIMDFWGGFLTFAALLMGALVISGGTIESQYCLYYVLMCLVIAIFDIILCVERGLHVKYSLLSRRAPLMFNVASVIFLLSPHDRAGGDGIGCIHLPGCPGSGTPVAHDALRYRGRRVHPLKSLGRNRCSRVFRFLSF